VRQLTTFSHKDRDFTLAELPQPLDLDALAPGSGPWELELGFGKGRYLLRSAEEHPERRYLGIEVVSKYYRLLLGRARRRGLTNLVPVRGEALYLLSSALPRGFADAVHVYFPDPWPKKSHRKRRLFDPQTVDLVLGALCPGGELFFASDFLEYGDLVIDLLRAHPELEVEVLDEPWPDGARTNYEAKFVREGRPIRRLRARFQPTEAGPALHPRGALGIVSALHPNAAEESAEEKIP
jgi:tRNA (guanine-N7-)-methyltransferase